MDRGRGAYERDYEGFIAELKNFRETVLLDPTVKYEELENAWKAMTLFYFNLKESSEIQRMLAVQRYKFVSREVMSKLIDLELQEL